MFKVLNTFLSFFYFLLLPPPKKKICSENDGKRGPVQILNSWGTISTKNTVQYYFAVSLTSKSCWGQIFNQRPIFSKFLLTPSQICFENGGNRWAVQILNSLSTISTNRIQLLRVVLVPVKLLSAGRTFPQPPIFLIFSSPPNKFVLKMVGRGKRYKFWIYWAQLIQIQYNITLWSLRRLKAVRANIPPALHFFKFLVAPSQICFKNGGKRGAVQILNLFDTVSTNRVQLLGVVSGPHGAVVGGTNIS